jgi:hypothetical protein
MKTLCALCYIPGLAVAAAVAVATLPTPAPAQSLGRSYDIIAPEPWLPPRHGSIASPRNPSWPAGVPNYNRVHRSKRLNNAERIPKSVPLAIPQQPSPTFVPGVGSVPNLPPAPGIARESFSDRTVRCVQQSGLYGVSPGQNGLYTRTCVNN